MSDGEPDPLHDQHVARAHALPAPYRTARDGLQTLADAVRLAESGTVTGKVVLLP